mmetsp:Transcript_65998/g.143826  ORF Transcript_65998/g.143826 Transcript_65998/m.143826 type:complete len:250 (+) Transcript_65998:239-988(+)
MFLLHRVAPEGNVPLVELRDKIDGEQLVVEIEERRSARFGTGREARSKLDVAARLQPVVLEQRALQTRFQGMHLSDRLVIKCDHDRVLKHPCASNCLHCLTCGVLLLQFANGLNPTASDEVQGPTKRRHRLSCVLFAHPGAGIQSLDIFQPPIPYWTLAIRRAVQGLVMHEDRDAIGGEVNVKLNRVGPCLDSAADRGEGVLRRNSRIAPVRNVCATSWEAPDLHRGGPPLGCPGHQDSPGRSCSSCGN